MVNQQARISNSEANDEDNFFFGGTGTAVNKQHIIQMLGNDDDLAGFGDEPFGNQMAIGEGEDDEIEPLVGPTLNLFKLSGQNMPTETDKYESSVYQTPELNPNLNESMKINLNDSTKNATDEQLLAAIKKLEYDSNSQQQRQRQPEILMSTMTKARPGIGVSNFVTAQDSGSEENVPDSNESSFEEDQPIKNNEKEIQDISDVIKNPFE